MLKLYESFNGTLVLSLRIGGPIARVLSPIINPNNLFIEGWFVEDNRSKETMVLLTQDVRDLIKQGIAVNDHEVLSEPEDLVRLKSVIDLGFSPVGLKVQTQSGKNYGKVSDFAFETTSFYIKKLYVAQPVYKNFASGTISVDRTQILEITTKKIVIEDPTVKDESLATAPAS